LALAATSFALGAGVAHAEGDVEAGKRAFLKCKSCHSLDAGKSLTGPSLNGIMGRKGASDPGYKYSQSLIDAGVTWDDAALDKYILDPKSIIPKGKMSFAGIKDAKQRADIIAYLKEATK
jgi:cytochrome c